MPLKAHYRKGLREAGLDEAGRGCLAGPVYAAAVVLPPRWDHPWLNDSKQLTADQRQAMRAEIENVALDWAVAQCDVEEIGRHNILGAAILAMHKAVDALRERPELLLVDGNRFRAVMGVPHVCVVGGDGIYRAIAAASILAKTWRDEHMARLNEAHPQYGWLENKGYPTPMHREALRHHGPTIHHRGDFRIDGTPIRDWKPRT